MVAVASQIDSGSEQFAANRASMMTFVERLRALEKRAQGASAKRRATFEKRGQLIPSDRLNRLLDPGMPFLRLHTLANFGVDNPDQDTSIPGASVMVGIGFVGACRCMIWVDDSGIAAGAMTGKTGEVALSLQTICKRQKLPLIHLVESAGANLVAVPNRIVVHVRRDLSQLGANVRNGFANVGRLAWWLYCGGGLHARDVRLRDWRQRERDGGVGRCGIGARRHGGDRKRSRTGG